MTTDRDALLWTALLSMQRHPWEQGVASHAAIDSGRDPLARLLARDSVVRQDAEGRLGATGDTGLVNSGACGEAVAILAREGVPGADAALDRQSRWFLQTCPRGESGILHHIEGSTEVWVDTVYMAVPFLVAIGHADEAEEQYRLHKESLWHQQSGLWGHIRDDATSAWVREVPWASGNGWVAAGLARGLRLGAGWLEADIKVGWRTDALALLEAMSRFERADGRFHDVLDDPNSFVDGTAGLMAAYAAFTGVAGGWLEESWKESATRWMEAALAHMGTDGLVRNVCGSPHFDKPGTSAEAQAFALMALAASKRVADR